jgi:TRAP-type C4-dicarboxylate transport system substrate-binding protein
MKRILIAAVAAGFVIAAQSAAAEPRVLRFTPLAFPGTAPYEQFYKPWADKVTADSHGALTIDLRGGIAIANIVNVYDRVMSNVVQIGFVLFNYVSGKFPYAQVAGLPNLSDDAAIGSAALWRLYKSGTLGHEFDQAQPLLLVALPQSLVHLATAPKTLQNLDSLKLVAPTQITALTAQSMGAAALTLSSPEAYEAINRHTADGTILSWNVYFTFKINEVTHYHIDQSMGTASGMIFMAKKVYDGLSPEAKKAIDENSGELASRKWGAWWDADNARGRAAAERDPKQTVVTLDAATKANWTARVDGAVAQWTKSRPGVDKVVAEYKRLLAAVKAGQ